MCPLCIGTAWLIAGGVSSAGGAATVAWRSVAKRRRHGAEKVADAGAMARQAKPRRMKAPQAGNS
jgi:hypothetical protein